jgi:signal transduction histidine kinase
MILPKTPANEDERLQELLRYDILDTPEEKEYDDIVLLASQICETPISLISLLDGQRQWFKAHIGLETRETPKEIAFCAHAIFGDDVFVVENALKDERFTDNPLVTGNPDIRFYAGMPLCTPSGFNLGTLCVIDKKPRTLSKEQTFALQVLAKQVVEKLELRLKIKELHAQQQELKRIGEIQTRMLSVITHDVRTPIHSLKGLLNLWTDKAISPEQMTELSQHLSKNLEVTLNLLGDLLQWSSVQLGQGKRKPERISLKLAMNEQASFYQNILAAKQNILVEEISEDLHVQTFPEVLHFVLRNLIHNAHKFTKNGRITVSTKKKENMIEISVADTGVGMSERVLNRLFNWETRHTSYGTANEKGSGLGLLICKEFIEENGGTITVNSNEGQGTKFTFTLPIA